MSDAVICLLVLAATLVMFVWNRLPVELVALGSAVALYFTGLLTAGQVFAGFGDPVIGFIAGLFVVSAGLNACGITAWAGQQLIARAGTERRRLLVAIMVLAALMTALIGVSGTTAALLPMVVLLAVRLGRSPSGLAMPLAFAGHAGSLLVLTGTPINILVSEAAADSGSRPFGYFEFAVVGIPLTAGVVLIAVLSGRRLLPERTPRSLPADLSGHARVLVGQYGLGTQAVGLRVPAGSPAVGVPVTELRRQDADGPLVIGAAGHGAPRGDAPLREDDVIAVHGATAAIDRFAELHGLERVPQGVTPQLEQIVLNRYVGAAELVLGPRSALVGDTVYPGMTTDSGELVILAIQRQGHELGPRREVLAAGDMLLVQGTWAAMERHLDPSEGVLIVDSPATVRRQAVPFGPEAVPAVVIVVAMVVLLSTGLVPPAIAAVLAAGAMVLTKVLTMDQAYEGISWTPLVVVAAMYPMSTAMAQSGAADELAAMVVTVFGGYGLFLLLGLFLLTAVLGQVISNTATALIVIPIAVSAAAEVGVSVLPVMMCVAVAASGAFLTPIATAANLMVKQPGGYRFGDYCRFGLPMITWFLVIAVGLVPLVWPL
ncbi:SLC13 family permease [Actinoplanes sp. NPDC049118]|uniref:SLC13 family permease n=1 Tax=Actinoplanes sp. NPDC049118 TaxID=3155769 RepID=UPI0033F9DC68